MSSCGDVLDRADDAARVPFERGLAPAEEAGLIGDDFDEHPVPHPGVADERFDGGDFHGLVRGVGVSVHGLNSWAMDSMSCSRLPAATTAMLSW